MYRIIDGRATGKTNKLFLLAKENDATIVCSNPYAMATKARAYGIIGLKFISYYDLIAIKDSKNFKYMIDELEGFMQAWATVYNNDYMIGYTLSNED